MAVLYRLPFHHTVCKHDGPVRSCFKIPGEFPSASEKVAVKAGEPARILKIRVDSTNADRRFCSHAKTAGDFKTAS